MDNELAANAFNGLGISPIIIGNHTHTTLGYNLTVKDFGETKGMYPTSVELEGGHQVLITNIPPHGQALGKLSVTFNDNGHIIDHSRNDTLLIDENITRNSDAKMTIANYKKQFPEHLNEVFARATIDISGLDGLPAYCKPISQKLEDHYRRELKYCTTDADAIEKKVFKELVQQSEILRPHKHLDNLIGCIPDESLSKSLSTSLEDHADVKHKVFKQVEL